MDKGTGSRDVGFGSVIVDFLIEPGADDETTPSDLRYCWGDAVHGNIPKRCVELPQICTQAKKLLFDAVEGKNFVAVRQRFTWTIARPPYKGRRQKKMWRNLYKDHWLLGAYKDTMPRRKWFQIVSGTFAASLFAKKTKGQVSSQAITEPVGESGSPESWEGSHPLSPFSLFNVITGNLSTQIPIVAFSGRGFGVSLTLYHNSSASILQPFGYGWTHSYFFKITEDWETGDAILTRGTGRKHRYIYDWLAVQL